jgi:hypothetical protein
MLVSLLSLALIGTADSPTGLTLQPVSPLRLPISRPGAAPQTIWIWPVAEDADGECECLDDNDNSDESSLAKQLTAKLAGSMSRHTRSLLTKLQQTAGTRHLSLPLIYQFCTLLI